MKAKALIYFLLSILIFSGCKNGDPEPYHPPSLNTIASSKLAFSENKKRDYNDAQEAIFDLSTGDQISGAYSKLIRTNNGIFGEFTTTDLAPKEVYTLWLIIFQNPEFCSDGDCGSDDITDANGQLIVNPDGTFGTPGVIVSSLWVSGTISDKNGNASLRINVEKDHAPGELLYGPGLVDPFGSEVHFIARTHGEVIPTMVDFQLSTLSGGCEVNACANQQFAIHLPI